MTPAEMKVLLQEMIPRPGKWTPKNLIDLYADESTRDTVVTLLNRADLLVELWEKAITHERECNTVWAEDMIDVLDKLERS